MAEEEEEGLWGQVARREAFVKARERYLPVDVLQRMGLYSAPPQCDVTVPFCEEGLLQVSDAELAAVYQEMVPTLMAGRTALHHNSLAAHRCAFSVLPPSNPDPDLISRALVVFVLTVQFPDLSCAPDSACTVNWP